MKPGTLIKIINGEYGETVWLYGGDDVPWDERGNFIPTDIPFGFRDIGLVISQVDDSVVKNSELVYLKVITPSGIGWVNERKVEEVG